MSRRCGPRLTLLGTGAAASPRYPPAGLLVEHRGQRVAIDAGPGTEPAGPLDAWLVCDERAELMPAIRRAARERGLEAEVASFDGDDLRLEPRPVEHTSHPAFGYLMTGAGATVAWAPEFWRFPDWAAGADILFADAAGWRRPIRFARGVGGHAAVIDVAEQARRRGVKRLVYAHIGRATIRAVDAGERPAFGELGVVGHTYRP